MEQKEEPTHELLKIYALELCSNELSVQSEVIKAVADGKLKAKDFVFVEKRVMTQGVLAENPENIKSKPVLYADPEVLLEPVIKQFYRPENGKEKLEILLNFIADPRLKPRAVYYLQLVGAALIWAENRAKDGADQKAVGETAAALTEAIEHFRAPLDVEAVTFLATYPEVLWKKIDCLIPGLDYTSVLSVMKKRECERVVKYLILNGYIKNPDEILSIRRFMAQWSECEDEFVPAWAEVMSVVAVRMAGNPQEQITSSRFNDLTRELFAAVDKGIISAERLVKILLLFTGANNVVTHHTCYAMNRQSTETVKPAGDAVQKLRNFLANHADVNLYRMVYETLLATPFEVNERSWDFPELCRLLTSVAPPDYEAMVNLLAFVKKCFPSRENYTFLETCMYNISRWGTAWNDKVELTEFKHWAFKLVFNDGLGRMNYGKEIDGQFVLFYTDVPNSLDWKKYLPKILNSNLAPAVLADAVVGMAAAHTDEKPDFLPPFEKLKIEAILKEAGKVW